MGISGGHRFGSPVEIRGGSKWRKSPVGEMVVGGRKGIRSGRRKSGGMEGEVVVKGGMWWWCWWL